MISYDEALQLTLASATRTSLETLSLREALGLVLAEDLVTPFPLPRFDNSAVDGYALSELMGGSLWKAIRTIGAGECPGEPLQPGECARIFTGAPTPPGTYAVVMQEDTALKDGAIQVSEEPQPGQNIRRAGEEFSLGAIVLPAGLPLNAAGVAAAATLGRTNVSVYRAPRVGIVVTGAELVCPGKELYEGQIYESNSYALSAALLSLGLTQEFVEVIGDDLDLTLTTLRNALQRCEVLITTGGVSVGDRDVVRGALEKLGVREVYWKVAIKPGKPVYLGTQGEKAVLGLPGNPLSVLATFTLLAQPFLKAAMGCPNPVPRRLKAKLASPIRHKPGRREFIPANLNGVTVSPILGQGSHMLGGMARADALIDVPADALEIPAEEEVWVIPFGQGSN
ncbi:MAG: molybdopterin molybdotransferase MoeA [Fimbriimonadaceae bacterium]|nr:molybdopterin molybdotransferase MoeA [Fimbriimonadaceae bacterium]